MSSEGFLMAEGKIAPIGLIGTITHDVITYASGQSFRGLGGVLYQAAVLCGLGKEVYMYTNCGQELIIGVKRLTRSWSTLHREGVCSVPGPGNYVFLHYPEKGERVEILESCVPPLNPDRMVKDLPQLGMLLLIMNSGFDIELRDWRRIVHHSSCPIWFDVHSLPLARILGSPRSYLPLTQWKEWASGVDYLQANRKEVASMLSLSQEIPSKSQMVNFAHQAFSIGIRALFITLSEEGALVLTPEVSEKITSPRLGEIVDTTGCGDVFCAATVAKLIGGTSPFEAASYGILLASKQAQLSGVNQTYALALRQES